MEKHIILSRHSIKKPKTADDSMSKEYEGITVKGVELARQSANNILEELKQSPSDSVFFLGGVSDNIRTRSTARVYGDELKKLLAGKKDYVFVTEQELRTDITKDDYIGSMFGQLKRKVDDNPGKRVIVDFPLFIKQLSKRRLGWVDDKGDDSAYATKLLEKANGNEQKAFRYWIENQGEQVDGLKGPKPVEVAKEYQKGLNRLEQFVGKYIRNRPIVTGFVAHSWDADAFLTYVAGDGKVDLQTFDRISMSGPLMKETEMGAIKINNGTATLTYRGQKHTRKLEHIVAAIGVIGILGALFSLSGITGNVVGASYNNPLGIISVIVFLTAMLLYSVIREIRA